MRKSKLPTRIEAERVYLRSYQAGDGPWLYKVSQKNRAHLARYESDNFLRMIDSEQKAEEFSQKESDGFVAQIYVGSTNKDLPEYIVGFIADVDHQRQGYVTEALQAALGFIFNQLKAHRVFLECDDTNQRSWEVAERCGFIREGHLRENKKHPGSPLSGTYVYGLLRSEWEDI